ncbi:MAG: hypothetical protein ACHP9Z_11870 [Streptosporangiales bacterium]
MVDKIFEFLGEIAASGAALLLVEQYVSRALALGSHMYLLNKGDVVFSGKPRSPCQPARRSAAPATPDQAGEAGPGFSVRPLAGGVWRAPGRGGRHCFAQR